MTHNLKIAAACLTLILVLSGMSAFAQSTLTVQGIGSVRVDADRAGISLGVREISGDVMSAQSLVNGKIADIVATLKEMGVEADEISTSGIGIYPNYNYNDEGMETIAGYTAYDNIYLTVFDVDNTGAYIDAAFAAGANSLDYVEFSATETEEASEQALRLAVTGAQQKAQILADAAGMRLGQIIEIRDGDGMGADGNSAFVQTASAEKGSGTEVMAAKQTVSAAVTITFALEP